MASVSVYFIIMPRALKFAELFALWWASKCPMGGPRLTSGLSPKIMLGMGLGFELPVVLGGENRVSRLPETFAMRRYMIVITLILARC